MLLRMWRPVFAVLIGSASAVAAAPGVRYELRFPNRIHHEAEVRATFSGVETPVLHVFLSRSSPGRYALHEFAKNMYNVRVSDERGRALPVSQPSPSEWDVMNQSGTVVFDYTIYGDRLDGTYDAIDETHAHLNMPATLIWASGFETAACVLRFDLPRGANWKAATQLIPQPDGTWSAPNLEWLMDSPVELSEHNLVEWTDGNQRFRLSIHQRGTFAQAENYAEICKRVVREETAVFGALPHYDGGTYTFLMDYLPYAFSDGMEHRDSTVITDPSDLGMAKALISTVAHEFFHCWNVKRIRPRSLEPFDFERANVSGELWFAEGFTSYYETLVLTRAGLSELPEFARRLGRAVNAVLTMPGRSVRSVVGMSRQAPFSDAATSIDPNNHVNTYISYYIYGEALGAGIDLAIRSQFPGKSLDDWMRKMWQEHPDKDNPYTLEELQHALGEVTSREFAADIFRRNIYGMQPMNYQELLRHAGLLLRKRSPERPWLGPENFKEVDGALEVESNTLKGSPVYEAGLDRGDRILEWNGIALKDGNIDALLEHSKIGQHVRLTIETRSGGKTVDLILQPNPGLELISYEQAGKEVSPDVLAFRKEWLSSKVSGH